MSPSCPCLVLVITGDTAAVEGGGEELPAGGLALLSSWPHGFLLLGTHFLMGLKKEIAFSRKTLYFSAFKRIFFPVIFISRESGVAILVQLHYLFEALTFIEK